MFLLCSIVGISYCFANKFYPATALTGGGTGALDKLSVASLSDGDAAIVILENDGTYGNAVFIYAFDATSTTAESSPEYIRPDDYDTAGVWELTNGIFTGISIPATATGPQLSYYLEDSDNGSNFVGWGSPASNNNDLILLIPTADPLAGQIITFAVPASVTGSDGVARDSAQGSFAYPGASQTPVIDDPDNFASNFTGANLYGGTFIANTDGTAALPDAAVGMNFTYVLEGANANIIDPDGTGTADTITMNGLAAAQDENVVSSTSGAMCVFQYRAANSWMATCNGFAEATPP